MSRITVPRRHRRGFTPLPWVLCAALLTSGATTVTTPDPASTGSGTSGATVSSAGSSSVAAGPRLVLAALGDQVPAPSTPGLSAVLDPLLARTSLGTSVSAEVVDVATGESVYRRGADRLAVPASTAKILTAVAALSVLGSNSTLATRAVLGEDPGQVLLVGGGDVLLSPEASNPDAVQGHAGLADLASATAAALTARGTTSVSLKLDDSLFSGPAVSPTWRAGDVSTGYVAPVMAIEMNGGLVRPTRLPVAGAPAARLNDPALAAARRFSTLLSEQGITVKGSVTRAQAPDVPVVLAEVRSATIADIVEFALTDSDNTSAEALARLVAIAAEEEATFTGGGRAVLDAVEKLGVPTQGAALSGGSGLGVGTALSAHMIAATLVVAAGKDHPELRAALTGLPVAGASGTLTDRFTGPLQTSGRGVVRAKTGTLTGTSALAGTVVDAEGRHLGFVVIADAVTDTDLARVALDQVAVALAGCGCR